jgi:DNA-binding CsgD family transcriptional regulator
MRLPSEQQMATDRNSSATPKKPRGRPYKPGESGNPNGRPPGIEAKPASLTIPQAVSAVELAAAGRTPRQIARLLKARPEAVKEALSQSRRLLEVCSPKFAEHWLRASEVAAEDGDHKPAMAALQSIDVVKPIAQTYDTGPGAKAVAAVKVEFHGFSLPGLPQAQPPAEPVTVDVSARSEG